MGNTNSRVGGAPPAANTVSGRMPDVIIIGAAKSGTTSLARRLEEHPALFLSRHKEPEFFSHDENYARGLDWYCRNFDGAGSEQLCVEASTAYTRSPQHPHTARRLHQHCPAAKLIYLMRHPVDRAYSHFVHRFTKELYPGQPFDRTFEEHIRDDPMCVDSSDYKLQIEKYLQHYPLSAFLFLFTHELARDELGVLRKVCGFVGVDPAPTCFDAQQTRRNVAAGFRESRVRIRVTDTIKALPLLGKMVYAVPKPIREMGYQALRRLGAGRTVERAFTPPPLSAETRRALIARYKESNTWVAELTRADLSCWND